VSESWEILDEDETPVTPDDTLTTDTGITASLGRSGYSDTSESDGIVIEYGDLTIVVGLWGGQPHIQLYRPNKLDITVQGLASGRKDLTRQKYIRIRSV